MRLRLREGSRATRPSSKPLNYTTTAGFPHRAGGEDAHQNFYSTRLWSCQTGFRLQVQDTDGPPAFQTRQLPNLTPAARPRAPITPDIHGRTLPKEFPLRIPFFDSTARFVERVRRFILLYPFPNPLDVNPRHMRSPLPLTTLGP